LTKQKTHFPSLWNFFHALHGLAGMRFPIIVSNACSSWRKVSKDISFAGTRTYVGLIIDVVNTEAIEFVDKLLTKHIERPISVAVWRSQNDIYADGIRRPYLVQGTHFTKLNSPTSCQIQYLKKQIAISANRIGFKFSKGIIMDITSIKN